MALLFSVLEKTWAQTPNWLWAHSIGGDWYDIGTSIAVDQESGDIFTTGYFYITADFDTGPGIFNLTTAAYGAFISKTDSEGNFIWSKGLSGTGYSSGDYIALDQSANGSVYTLGEFSGTIDFDPGPDIYSLTSDGAQSTFMLKLDLDGEFIWVKTFTIVSSDAVTDNSIALDPSGSGEVYFNCGSYSTKLDSSGNVLWTRTIGGDGNSGVTTKSIAFDPSTDGGVYTTGEFYGTIDFNPGEEVYNMTTTGNKEIFISKLNSDGNFVWAISMKGENDESRASGTSIAIDPSENGGIYTTGNFWKSADFNPGDDTFNLTEGGIFISKLDSHGQFIWAKSLKGTDGFNTGYSMAIDPSNNGDIYITGLFMGKVDFDPGSEEFNINTVGLMNSFLSKLDSSGNFIWVKTMSGFPPRLSAGLSIALDHEGYAHLTGYFNSASFAFDSIMVTNADGEDPGQDGITNDIFIAKLNTLSPSPVADSKSIPLMLSPNPTKDKIEIEYENVELQNALITVYNLAGELLFSVQNEVNENKVTIDISALASGIYFIQLEMNGNCVIEKVVKE